MKKFFTFVLITLTLVGFGCQTFGGGSPKLKTPDGWTVYENPTYGFALAYPNNMELKDRAQDQQDSTYANLSGKFFASLREVKREKEPTTLALFYAFKGVTPDQFSESLQASDQGNITIKETSEVIKNGLTMKKVISTTAIGLDKTHYLFVYGEDLVVISVVLGEEEVFQPILDTMVKL